MAKRARIVFTVDVEHPDDRKLLSQDALDLLLAFGCEYAAAHHVRVIDPDAPEKGMLGHETQPYEHPTRGRVAWRREELPE